MQERLLASRKFSGSRPTAILPEDCLEVRILNERAAHDLEPVPSGVWVAG